MVTTTATLGSARAVVPAHFGVNGADVKSKIAGWLAPEFKAAVTALAPPLIRYAGGTTANTWRYRTGTSDASWGGYTEGGAKNADGTPVTLPLARFKELCDAAGAVPIFDLNVACDAAVYGTAASNYTAKPYGLPNLTETLAFLDAAANIGLPVTYLELGNEFFTFDDASVKTNYAFAPQASGLSDPNTGVPYTSTSFPAGYVWNYSTIATAPGTLNANGQDEYLLALGKTMTGFPEPADVTGLGAGGGAWLYGVRASKWIKAIKTWAAGRSLPTPKFLVVASNPQTAGLGPTSKKWWNRGLMAGLDASGPGVPDYFVLHPYWHSNLSFTYGSAVPSIDPASAGYSSATVDEYMSAQQERTDTLTVQVMGAAGTDPTQVAYWYSLKSLIDAGMRMATTEFGVLELVNLFPPPSTANTGVDQGHGGFGQILATIASVLYRTEVWPLDLQTVHSLYGATTVSGSINATTTGFRSGTLYAYGFNTPRTASGLSISGTTLTVGDGSLTSADVQAKVVVGGTTAFISAVQSGTSATLTATASSASGSGTIEQALPYPQFRLAGAAYPLPGPPTTLWSKTATGYASLMLGRCTRGTTSFTPMAFSGSPMVNDTGSTNRGLFGGQWSGTSKTTALVVNLRQDSATVTLPPGLQGAPALVLSAASLAVPVTDVSSFTTTQVTTGSTVTLPAHSVLYVNVQAASPAAMKADLADPTISGGTTTTQVRLATYTDAQAVAAAAQVAAQNSSLSLSKFTAKGVLPVGTAPNTVGTIDPTGQPDGQVIRTSTAAGTGWAFASAYPAMSQLTDAGPSLGTYTGTGSIGAASSNLTDAGTPGFTAAMTGRTLTITAANNAAFVGCVFTTTYFSSTKLTLTYVSGNGGVNPLPPASSAGNISYTVAPIDQMIPTWDTASGRWLGKLPITSAAIVGAWMPDDSGRAGWSLDNASTTTTMPTGRLYGVRVKVARSSFTQVAFQVTTAATALTAGAPNKVYVYNDAGTTLLGSYDVLNGDQTIYTAIGSKTVTLSAAFTGSLSGFSIGTKVLVCFLFNGTGSMAVSSSAGQAANLMSATGNGSGSRRYALYGAASAYATVEPSVPLPAASVPGTTVGIPYVVLD